MNNQQKYLSIGAVSALAIVIVLKALLENGMNNNVWMLLLSVITAGMVYLVFNIFVLTLSLAPVKSTRQQAVNNKMK